MARHNPVDDTERQAIIELIRTGLSRNQVAKQAGRSTSTITRIGESIGWDWLSAVDERTQSSLARAHEARSAFSAERRAMIAARLTAESEELLDGLHGPYLVFNFGGKENDYNEHTLSDPPVEAKRQIVQTVRDAMRTVIDIDRHDNRADEGLAAVDEWLRGMIEGAAA